MGVFIHNQLSQMETTCANLLSELQVIWDEVGENDEERDKMLFELEQECLEVYRRKVDQANRSRAQLRQAIADAEAELAEICSAMGEPPVHIREKVGTLKAELGSIAPQVEVMQKRKSERLKQFLDVIEKIQHISNELMDSESTETSVSLDCSDLSNRRLEELRRQLESIQNEKNRRLEQVLDYMHTLSSLCSVLGIDFKVTVSNVHPSLDGNEGSISISDSTMERLSSVIKNMQKVKIQRMQQLQDLATTMLELWNLMDTPIEEQKNFQNVTCNVASSEDEITEPNMLSEDFIKYVEAEVMRLEEVKVDKMKEFVLKKKAELEELCRHAHMVTKSNREAEFSFEAIEAGTVNPSFVLEQIEYQISMVKEEAFSRKEILEKVDKWMAACEEESWLEEYNRDENRYSAGRGAHLTLRRAEKARLLVNKIPAMVDSLASKIISWERERATEFTYDGIRLLSMLEEYNILREEKEQEKKRQRDQKRLQGQLIAEQEVLYGSKPSPSKHQSNKKAPRNSMGGPNRRLSLGGALLQASKPTRSNKKGDTVPTFSAASRGLDIAGVPLEKLPANTLWNTREADTPRKPFAALIPANSSAIPVTPQRHSASSVPEEAAKTPMPTAGLAPAPQTPMTVSAPMQMATTPAPGYSAFEEASSSSSAAVARETGEVLEYSFEERRLAFILAR